jgi:RNA polymerase sigma-70 factor (ECF subfamily)
MQHSSGEASDADLILASRSDSAPFGVVYERHALAVYRWCQRRLDWAASDLTAETFARAWLKRGRFCDDGTGSALPWLLGIAQNVLRETLRHDRVESTARERLGLPLEIGNEDGYRAVEERLSRDAALTAAFDGLPRHERDALELRVVKELPYGEVAEQLAIRPTAARRRVSRALRRLALATTGKDQDDFAA